MVSPPPLSRSHLRPRRRRAERMSMPAAVDRFYSRDEVLALPEDGNRYELVYGELLVTPSPALLHQLVVGRLFASLHAYVERHAVGRVFVSPADLSWGRDDLVVQPDVFVVSPPDARSTHWAGIRRLALVAEVLSLATARFDRVCHVRVPGLHRGDPGVRVERLEARKPDERSLRDGERLLVPTLAKEQRYEVRPNLGHVRRAPREERERPRRAGEHGAHARHRPRPLPGARPRPRPRRRRPRQRSPRRRRGRRGVAAL